MRAPGRACVGIGLRAPHHGALLESRPALGFLEVHAENFFGEGGAELARLERFREIYPLSVHGVGLSAGGTDPLDERHLSRLAALVERFEPFLVSEHLCWSAAGGHHANDLLPLPHTVEALGHVVGRVQRVQERLGRTILLENVSSYVAFEASDMPEAQFLAEVSRRSGCGVLLDVNNAWVSARNQGTDPHAFLAAMEGLDVGEIHLAGHESWEGLLVDSHGDRVCPEVWSLYEAALRLLGPRPTLIEWDTRIPELDVLLSEAALARERLEAAAPARGLAA